MPSAEDMAAMFEAIEEVDDDPFVLAVLFALRDEGFKRELAELIETPLPLRRALAGRGRTGRGAANDQGQ